MDTYEFVNKIKNNEIDIVEHTHKVIEECKKINKEYNYLNVISEELALEQAKNIKKSIKNKENIKNKKLLGVAVSVKDSICVKNVESAAGSRILKGYKPLFDATVIKKAKEQGAIIIGKTSQDEFGFGGFSVNVGLSFKIPKNPFDKQRSCGGSSGGAAGITQKASFPHIALGESTGGSIAEPSSFCGVFGLCPTYGRVSRYGLIDYANSLDKIGPMGKSLQEVALLQETISGFDQNESTTINKSADNYTDFTNKKIKNVKIGIIKEAFENIDNKVNKKTLEGIKKLEEAGIKTEEVSLKMPIKYGLATYYMLATSEASTNLAKYCGMRYGISEKLEGNFNEYFTKVRSSNFGAEAKRRIILGTFARMSGYRDAYYIKATKVRTKIVEEYKKLFKKYDALISPTVPILPPKFSEIEKLTPLQQYMIDTITVSPNVAGLPHLNVPVGFENNLPVGMLLTADHLEEGKLIQLGSLFEKN
ncbi:MAG: amidase family protein [Candidatus Woesearchaeota archaeon]|jgi:aspartyl-tRNA(Asn)/glutamyl-tRNA(Gln) amidotransferase subunit A|nr:amidase family protein [Candidatus Woesearchaeota archaeon]MDP7622549.1 amidase family protein [Candidatus Woesearchaeota archaeon]HJN56694.1 amidase family protein [Candidatus Woesearchaeota archaeon]|tara:strand:+ start:8063 stop:9493 length:1431 start_codon:yes stop_codon:yes gene_type:complete